MSASIRNQALLLAPLLGLGACGDEAVAPEPASLATSTISADATYLYADGASTATITVTLRDPRGGDLHRTFPAHKQAPGGNRGRGECARPVCGR